MDITPKMSSRLQLISNVSLNSSAGVLSLRFSPKFRPWSNSKEHFCGDNLFFILRDMKFHDSKLYESIQSWMKSKISIFFIHFVYFCEFLTFVGQKRWFSVETHRPLYGYHWSHTSLSNYKNIYSKFSVWNLFHWYNFGCYVIFSVLNFGFEKLKHFLFSMRFF